MYDTLESGLPCEQRFLSYMAFSVYNYEDVRVACRDYLVLFTHLGRDDQSRVKITQG